MCGENCRSLSHPGAKPKDLQFSLGTQRIVRSLHPNKQCQGAANYLNFVIPSEGEGSAVLSGYATTIRSLHPNNQCQRAANHLNFVIPSEGEGSAVLSGYATTIRSLHPNNQRQGAANHLNFVIPSEAEGPAVRLSPKQRPLQMSWPDFPRRCFFPTWVIPACSG